MNNGVKIALITAVFTFAGVVVGNIAPIVEATAKIKDESGGGETKFSLGSLPRPTAEVGRLIRTLEKDDIGRVLDFRIPGPKGDGLVSLCMYDDTKPERDAFGRLAALGLGEVVENHDEPAPEVYTIGANDAAENEEAFCTVDKQMLERMCTQNTICPDRFSFVPNDEGIALRNYLRDVLAALIRPDSI